MAKQQVWVTNTMGGYSACPKLSRQLRHAVTPLMRFRQFCDAKLATGKHRGNAFLYDKISKVVSTATRKLTETSTIPRSNIVVGQGTATLDEFGIAIGHTQKLEQLGEFDINNPIHRALRDDMAESIDAEAGAAFKTTLARYCCLTSTSGTLATAGTLGTNTAGVNLNKYHINQITDQLKKWNVPAFDDGDYVCISSITAIRGIKDETAVGGWIDASRYAGSKRLWKGEVGEYMGVRFLEETNVLSNACGSGSAYGEAMVFGPDTVAEGVAVPEEIRHEVPRDFGRDLAVAWYALLGFKLIWCGTGEAVSTANGWVPRVVYVTSVDQE